MTAVIQNIPKLLLRNRALRVYNSDTNVRTQFGRHRADAREHIEESATMFENLIATLKADKRKIVFTEGPDPRILEAAARL